MKERKPSIRLLYTIIAILIITTVAVYLFSFSSLGKASSGSIGTSATISGIVLVLICFLCSKFKKEFFNEIRSMNTDLEAFIEKIKECADSDSCDSVWNYIQENPDSFFQNEHLKKQFENYMHEMERLEVEDAEHFRCDISDYIFYSDIVAYANKPKAENIAASMTGIGILGTFIGLAFGLQSFDTSTTTAMADSIVPLIDGIKSAFYTSIYGVSVSLVLNHILKQSTSILDRRLEEFYNVYHEYVLTSPEFEFEKKEYDLCKEQTEIMSSFSESVSVALSREMQKIITPIFDRLDTSIQNFTHVVAENQAEGLETIVNNFVSQMNQALNNQFEELANTIEETCKWQKESVQAMDKVIKEITEEAYNINDINIRANETIEHFDQYLEKLLVQEENLSKQADLLGESLNTVQNGIESVKTAIDGVIVENEKISETNAEMAKVIGVQTEQLRENSEAAVKINEELRNNMEESVQKYLDAAERSLHQIEDALTRVDESMKHSSEHLEDSYQKIQTSLEEALSRNYKKFDEELSKLNESAEKYIQTYSKAQDDMEVALDRTFNEFDKELANMTKYIGAAMTSVNESAEKVPKVSNEVLTQMKNKSAEFMDSVIAVEKQVAQAAANMEAVSASVEKVLQKYREETAVIQERKKQTVRNEK